MNDREQGYLKVKSQPQNEKCANGRMGARVRLIVRGGCLPVRCFKGKNGNMLMICEYECRKKEIGMHVFLCANAMLI